MGEARKITQKWELTYEHAAGETATYFFEQLENHKAIFGKRCPQCRRVLLPPRAFCDRCFVATAEWVEVGKKGTIESFTFVFQKFKGSPEPPYALAYVTLAGADCSLVNYLRNVDFSDLQQALALVHVGAPVKVVFADPPQGRITDFWFELEDAR